MSDTFTCPSCSAPLDYKGGHYSIRCPYCNGSVIVPETLRDAPPPVSPATKTIVAFDEDAAEAAKLKEIAELIRLGNKIQAVKLYRQLFDVSLAKAKDAVDRLEQGKPVIHPGVSTMSGGVVGRSSVSYYNPPRSNPPSKGGWLLPWLGAMFGMFWVSFLLVLVGAPIFPDSVRLAAPVTCPEGYDGAYGEFVGFYRSGSFEGTNIALLNCFDGRTGVTVADPLLTDFVLCIGYWAVLGLMAFIVIGYFRSGNTAAKLAWLMAGVAAVGGIGIAGLQYYNSIPTVSAAQLSDVGGVNINALPTLDVPEPAQPEQPVAPISPARQVLVFGSEGKGLNQFDDARYFGIDGAGNMYVGQHSDQLPVQVFDDSGMLIANWALPEPRYLTGLAVDSKGTVYLLQGGELRAYNGMTGEPLKQFVTDGRFQSIVTTFDDKLVAVGDEVIVRFDADGVEEMRTAQPLSETLGERLSVSNVAVDAEGNIYIVSTFIKTVFKFSAEGRFVDRIGSEGDSIGQFRTSPDAIAVDHRGRLYVGDSHGVQVLGSSGSFLFLIDIEGYTFDLAFNPQGQLVVLDRNAHQISVWAIDY